MFLNNINCKIKCFEAIVKNTDPLVIKLILTHTDSFKSAKMYLFCIFLAVFKGRNAFKNF